MCKNLGTGSHFQQGCTTRHSCQDRGEMCQVSNHKETVKSGVYTLNYLALEIDSSCSLLLIENPKEALLVFEKEMYPLLHYF